MTETFFGAQRRHRRTARLYTALAAVAAVGQGLPLAMIVSPVFFGLAVLVADVVNLWHPVSLPSVRPDRLVDDDGQPGNPALSLAPLVPFAVPGMVAVVALWWLVRRFLLRDGLGGVLLAAGGRAPRLAHAEEHQLVNVVAEMAIAAGITPPRVLVLPAKVPNAAAFGRDPDHATIAVSRGLLDDLDRDATQGVVAHLVGSVANGDLRMQHSLLALFVSQQLAQDLLGFPFAPSCRQRVRGAWRMFRGQADAEDEAATIAAILAWDDSDNFVVSVNSLTFKLVQFYTTLFVVGGLLTLPFRTRRYLADATAVELARNPDGLGRALVHLEDHRKNLPGAAFATIYAISAADQAAGDETLEDAVTLPASLHPPMRRRVRRLRKLGFRGDLRPEPKAVSNSRAETLPGFLRWPLTVLLWLVCAPILAVLGVALFLVVTAGVGISVFLGALFWAALTFVVVAPVHAVLQALA
jgi:heat shock protein HtpX